MADAQPDPAIGSAHDRQNKSDVRTATYLAYITTILFFALIFTLMLYPKTLDPTTSATGTTRDLLFTLLGVVATGWATIVGYYYGSSSGSAQKSLALAQALSQKGERGTPAVQLIKPNPLTRQQGTQPMTIQGLNLDIVKSVRISPPQGNAVDATNVHSTATAITCDVLVGPADPTGDWDVSVFDDVGAGGTATNFPKILQVV